MLGIDDAASAAMKLLDDGINKIWPNPEDRASADAITIKATADAAIGQLQASMSVMLAEAQSADKWTSRARPSFLYVMYTMILCALPMGIVSAFNPAAATHVADGLRAWLAAIPSDLWSVFGFGYAGYTMARTSEKAGGLLPALTGKKK